MLVLRKTFEGFSAGTQVFLEVEDELPKKGLVSVVAWCDPNYLFEVPVEDIVVRRKRTRYYESN